MASIKRILLILFIITGFQSLSASKLVDIKVVDKDYLVLHFQDGVVEFVDDGLGAYAYHGHHTETNNSKAKYFGDELDLVNAAQAANWTIKSSNDTNYGKNGVAPAACFRKSKVNGMDLDRWGSNDWIFNYTNEHFIYLQLPFSLESGGNYTVELNENLNADTASCSITFDIFNCPSEAIHTNLVGYMSSSRIKAADLYHFLGDGGNRDYSDFVGNAVYIYNVDTQESEPVGSVAFWMNNQKEKNHNLTGSDVWNVDFTGFTQPGTFRLAVEGVGCSEDFEIRDDIYHDPYKLAVLGYFYMRIGQDNLDMTPVPRRPLYIQDQDPSNCKIYVTDMHPFHPQWNSFANGDKWDRPDDWAQFVKEGEPTNAKAIGGHSDALDWDRHLGHVSNIYDLCLAYIVSNGSLDDDDLRIAESGNGIPDILDEARNEVDFWLNLRYQGGYSHGITNPDKSNRLYQSDNTAIAAWANALNSSMLAYCFQIAGQSDLKNTYQDSAIVAFQYADNLPDPMLDKELEGKRGVDLKMMAAAFLYNLTGDTKYEDIVAETSMVTDANSAIHQQGSFDQLWGTAAYLLTNQPVHYPDLQANMKAAIIAKAKSKEADKIHSRPSRRGRSDDQSYWQTSQDMHRTVLAHAVSENPTDKIGFLDAMLLEADWGLGRNPLNMIQMTTATTELADKRSVENCYTSGRDDGTPGLHPGHTPYLNIDSWGGVMVGSNPQKVLDQFYPDSHSWPHASKYINTRFIWTHSEFTPRQTMRGKALLYAYLYSLSKSGGAITPVLIADAGKDQRIVDQDHNGKETVQLDGSKSYSGNSHITSYTWKLGDEKIAAGKTTTVELDTGSYVITLEVLDNEGESASDSVNIDIISQAMDQEADYDFETAEQLDDWNVDNWGEGGKPTAALSSAQAFNGSQSVQLSGNYVENAKMVFKRSGALNEDVETIFYYVWIPQALVDASESNQSGGIQSYLMHTDWEWRDTWINLSALQGDAWNVIPFQIPDDVSPAEINETGLVCSVEGAGIGESSIYIDDVTYKVAVPQADFDFETSGQFDEWTVENWGDNGGNPMAMHSTERARSGEYSFKMEANFVAGSENAIRRNAPLEKNVTAITYQVWIPQDFIDKAQDVANSHPGQAGLVQCYVLHTNWQWFSVGYDFIDLNGNAWNEVVLNLPENVDPAKIQSIGVSFKTNGVDAGKTSVYVDDITFVKAEDPTSVQEGKNLAADLPRDYKLYNNYPNPFNPETTITYNLPKDAHVKMHVYDVVGRQVKTLIDEPRTAGQHKVTFQADDLASGVYFYTIKAGSFKAVKKMILVK